MGSPKTYSRVYNQLINKSKYLNFAVSCGLATLLTRNSQLLEISFKITLGQI